MPPVVRKPKTFDLLMRLSLPDEQYRNMELGAGRYEYRIAADQQISGI